MDGVGPVNNAQAAGLGIAVRERRVVADAHAAEHLNRPVDHRGGHRSIYGVYGISVFGVRNATVDELA